MVANSIAWCFSTRIIIRVGRRGATPIVGFVARSLVWEWLGRVSLMTWSLLLEPVIISCPLLLDRGARLRGPVLQI